MKLGTTVILCTNMTMSLTTRRKVVRVQETYSYMVIDLKVVKERRNKLYVHRYTGNVQRS